LDKGTARVMVDESRCAKEWPNDKARTARIAGATIVKAAKKQISLNSNVVAEPLEPERLFLTA